MCSFISSFSLPVKHLHMSLLWILGLFLTTACQPANTGNETTGHTVDTTGVFTANLPLDKIKLPPGFSIEVYADDLPNARSMTRSAEGTLYVGTRGEGSVYAVKDVNNDFRTDKKFILGTGMNSPNGVALKDGDLYVAEISRIWKYPNVEQHLDQPKKEVFYDDYPNKGHHGWKYIAFGPDGHLYVPVGAPCNVCESEDEIFASITRLNMQTKAREILHRGIRNTVGFTWHPQTKELWFTDNGGDWLGDDMPGDELNYAPREGMHFGYPYCHQGNTLDPKLGAGHTCSDYTPPAQILGPHVAALGMEFYTGSMFPAEYKNQIFIAEHGSWNRSAPIGYRITLVRLDGNKAVSYETFAEGWLQGGNAWGRPVDLELLPDGSMLVSDDYAHVIYRIFYEG